MSERDDYAKAFLEKAAASLKGLAKDLPGTTRMTLIVRMSPGDPDADLFISNDEDIEGLAETFDRLFDDQDPGVATRFEDDDGKRH